MAPIKAVLIYDGQCPVCSRAVAWIRENARKDSFEFVPCGTEEARRRFPSIKDAACMDAMQLIVPNSSGEKVFPGEKALPEILKRLKKYSPAASFFELPGTEALSRAFYRWFADRRYHIAEILFGEKKKDGSGKKP